MFDVTSATLNSQHLRNMVTNDRAKLLIGKLLVHSFGLSDKFEKYFWIIQKITDCVAIQCRFFSA